MDEARGVHGVRICVDGRMLAAGGTGVSTYARSLAAASRRISDQPCRLVARRTDDGRLAKWSDAWRDTTRRLHEARDAEGALLEGRDVFRRAHVHFDVRRRLYRVACDGEPGIMHWTYPVPMRMEGWINLYTVHDAIPLDRPDLTPIDPRRHRAVLDAILAQGDGITTVTQAARAAIVAALGCDPAFVTDTGQSVDVASRQPGELPPGLMRQGFLLVVGSIEPRKNLSAVLAAYRRSGTPLPLVIVGPDGWQAAAILAEIATTPGAIRLSYVARATLLALLAHARALVFVSLAEGFGLPVVEAMAVGTPVLTSDRGALAEVAGTAALTVDPTDVAALAAAIARLSSDDSLVATLAARGAQRATAFTGEAFADRLTYVYSDALQRRAGASTRLRTHVQRHGACGSE